jgi:HEAT repeat protein
VTEAIPGFIKVLEDDSEDSRMSAANALADMGPKAAGAVPAMLGLVKKFREEMNNRGYDNPRTPEPYEITEDAIVRIGPAAVPAVVELLKSGDAELRASAADVAGKMGPAAAAAVPPLLERLRAEPDASTISALGGIGPAAAAAVRDLEVIRQADKNDLGRWAKEALAKIKAPAKAP